MKHLYLCALAALGFSWLSQPSAAAAAPEISSFWLIDVATNSRIRELKEYDSITLPVLPDDLTIEALANEETESVLMRIEGEISSQENLFPYSLGGDDDGAYHTVDALKTPGWIRISAEPFSEDDGAGTSGTRVYRWLYIDQPDFFVTSAADASDYQPGDGVCSVSKPLPVQEAALKTSRAVPDKLLAEVSPEQLALLPGLESLVVAGTDVTAGVLPKSVAPKAAHAQVGMAMEIAPIAPELLLTLRPTAGGVAAAQLLAAPRSAVPENVVAIPAGVLPDPRITGGLVNVCTLRAAIEEANALSGQQRILVNGDLGTFALTKGQLQVLDTATIYGHGDVVIDGGNTTRVMSVSGEDTFVTLRDLHLTRGNASTTGRGGALRIAAGASVSAVRLEISESRGNFGGGVYLQENSWASFLDSIVRDNQAGNPDGFGGGGVTQRGGGLFNLESYLQLTNSAVYDNRAVRGGGLGNFGGRVHIDNTTFAGNEAAAIGGAIENHDNTDESGLLYLSFVTITDNHAGVSSAAPAAQRIGGGIYNTGRVFMGSSILAGNDDYYSAGETHHAPDCYSPAEWDFKVEHHNVIGVLNGQCLAHPHVGSVPSSDYGSESAPLDPQIFGGYMWEGKRYYSLASSSPAVDRGASQSASVFPCPERDMRGLERPRGAACDIGAAESY